MPCRTVWRSCVYSISNRSVRLASCDMEWSNKRTVAFIVDYRNSPELWNKTSSDYKNTTIRNSKLINLANKYKCTVREVKVKIKNLRSAYHRERKKVKTRNNSSSTPTKKWFAYEPLKFLSEVDEPLQTSLAVDQDTDDEDFETNEADYKRNIQHSQVELAESSTNLFSTTNKWKLDTPENRRQTRALTFPEHCLPPSTQEEHAYCATKKPCDEDSYSVFGRYVASELRNLNPRVQTIVKHLINNTLFDAAMGKYMGYDAKKNNSRIIPPENYENASEHVITYHTER